MKLALPVVIIIALVAFAAGMIAKDSFVSPFNAVSNQQQASDSAQVSTQQGNLPKLSGEAAPAASVSGNNHQLPNNSGSYTVNSTDDKVILNGNFRIPDFYKLNYNFVFPKNGGDITGKVSGVCDGTITGKSDKPDSEGEARIEGQFSGDCKPIPGLSFKTKASGTYEGQLQFKQNKVHIIYQINEPYSSRGGFELYF